MNNQRGKPYRTHGLSRIEEAGRLQASGMSNAEVAAAMHVSMRTVCCYLSDIEHGRFVEAPRCVCGLLLPCDCNGKKRRAEDFLGRREDANVHMYNGRKAC